ncbi:MAG: alginate O-acetyltransferase AlgX-related protein [Myxococcota bacterium]
MASELSWSRRLLFTAITIGFVLVSVEVLLQAFYYMTAGEFLFNRAVLSIYEEDDTRCYRVQPNLDYVHRTNEFSIHVYTDENGLRTTKGGRAVTYEKDPGVTRILFLGPSFAFGWGSEYEESYAWRIAEGLRERGHEVELLNLGTPAQAPNYQLCWLAKEGYKYAPDIVVQTDYGSIGGVGDGCPEPLECPIIDDGVLWRDPPTLRRRAFNAAKNLGVVFYGFYAMSALRDAPADGGGAGKELHGDLAKMDPGEDDAARALSGYSQHSAFVKRVLPDARTVYLYIPLSYVAHPEDAPRHWSRGEDDPFGERERLASAAAAVQARGIPFVDGTKALVAAAGDERLYYWLDIHLTPRGNEVLAEAAVPVLEGLVAP